MNILLVADVSIKKLFGGAERGLYEEALFLKSQSHQVYILTRKLSFHTQDDEIIDGIHEFRYTIDESNPLSYLLSSIFNAQQLFRSLNRDLKFDLINSHQPFGAFALNLLPETQQIKKVYTCHSLSFEEYISRHTQKKFGSTLNVWIRKDIERFSLQKADQIIVLSQFTKDKLIKTHRIFAEKIKIIPSGVNIQKFCPSDKNTLRQKLGIAPNTLILFTARNLTPRMGLDNLIKAAGLLKAKNISFKLFIGGQGPLKENLEVLIQKLNLQDQVTLCGFINDAKLIEYYQMADFFILPTIELEGFGLVTLEAMACSTPVLATPIGGSVEILSGFDKNFLFKDISPESIFDLILEKYTYYKEYRNEYSELCHKARAYVEKYYSWQNNAANVEALFREMVK